MSLSGRTLALIAMELMSSQLIEKEAPQKQAEQPVGDPELAANYRAERLARKAENFAKRQPKKKGEP